MMRTVLLVFSLMAIGGTASAQERSKLRGGLEIVPNDGVAIVSISVAKIWDHPFLNDFREQAGKTTQNKFGIPTENLDRITFIWSTSPARGRNFMPVMVVSTRKPHLLGSKQKNVKEGAFPKVESDNKSDRITPNKNEVAEKVPNPSSLIPPESLTQREILPQPRISGQEPVTKKLDLYELKPFDDDSPPDMFIISELGSILLLVDDYTFILLPLTEANQLVHFLKHSLRKQTEGPFSEILANAEKHIGVVAVNFQPLKAELLSKVALPRRLHPFRSLLKATHGSATLDIDQKSIFLFNVTFANREEAVNSEAVLKSFLQFASNELTTLRKGALGEADQNEVIGPPLDMLITAINKVEIKQSGATLQATTIANISPTVKKSIVLLPDFLQSIAKAKVTENNLKRLTLAMMNYEASYGYLPSDIVDPNGKKLLSWRVQLLPFLERPDIYYELDLTKAWDDPVNAKALAKFKMPKVFEIADRPTKEGETYFQVLCSDKELKGSNPYLVSGVKRTLVSIPDGVSNTFGIVEAAESVAWAKPSDLPFDPKKIPVLGNPKTGKFVASMLDASVYFFSREKITEAQLRAFITVDGEEANTYILKK